MTELREKFRALERLARQELAAETQNAHEHQIPAQQERPTMSDAVHDSNPYSRLMALKKMGVVDNYDDIRKHTCVVVGLGGIGSVAAEMLTRCGIGKLILFDYDLVELANMNRLFFTPQQVGMTKTAAAKSTLENINPDVQIEEYTYDITLTNNFPHFLDRIQHGGLGPDGPAVSLVISCVDNYAARVCINQACLQLDQPWLEAGVSEDAVSGHIQTMLPGRTACYECVPPLLVATGIDEKTLRREGVCAASLSTTMGIIAGLLVQNALKYLLGFGQTTYYLSYGALMDHFQTSVVKPSPDCNNRRCRELQQHYHGWKSQVYDPRQGRSEGGDNAKPRHSDNEWGIEVCESSAVSEKEAESASAFVDSVENLTLEELQEQLASLQAEQEWKMLQK